MPNAQCPIPHAQTLHPLVGGVFIICPLFDIFPLSNG
jgi:hypothetical protein